jgi:hypothetical protein
LTPVYADKAAQHADTIQRARDGELRRVGATRDLIGLVSPGTTNAVQYRFEPGRWLLVFHYGTLPCGCSPRFDHRDSPR